MAPHVPQVEICAETAQACSAASEGGADRIEICAALGTGGVTPSHGLIREAIAAAGSLPVYVLIRPRTGNFVYSDQEFRIMCADIEHALSIGAAGIVTGILTEQRAIDERRMSELVKLTAGREVTFHRAVDHTENLSEALERIIATGCRRLLTSGGRQAVREGLKTIVQLTDHAKGRIRIAAGGGVTSDVARLLRSMAQVDLHVSLRSKDSSDRAQLHDPLWNDTGDAKDILPDDVREFLSNI